MVKLNYDFDIAAILIDIILIFFYYRRKNIPSEQNRTFSFIVYILAFCPIMEVLTAYIDGHFIDDFPIALRWIMECSYFSAMNALGVVFAFYCFALMNLRKKYSRKVYLLIKASISVPYFFCLVIIWLAPVLANVHPMGFSIIKGVGYQRNSNIWFYIPYFVSTLYFFITFILIVVHRKEVSLTTKYLVSIYFIFVAAAVILQMVFFGQFLQCFALALVTLVCYMCIQRQEDVIDSNMDCFNQHAFDELTSQLFERKSNFTYISLILDDTYFIANTFGINQLNKIIKQVSIYLCQTFKFENVFYINQECFFILIKNPTEEKVQNIVTILQKKFEGTWTNNDVKIKLFSRICVTQCPSYAKTTDDLFNIISLVSNDERYKKPVIYAGEINLEDKRRSAFIEHAVHNGIAENSFEVSYQPIYSIADEKIIGAEALIRLEDEDGSFISPEDFIPIAEKTGMIFRIGEFVFEEVCRAFYQINIDEYDIKMIDVNLSVAQCMQESLASQIIKIKDFYNLDPSLINLEITETSVAHTPQILLKNMKDLVDAGFDFSLDDYGSGYSNMSYMLNFPFKMIKIDKFIVWAAFSDEKAKVALESTIKMIKAMGMTVLAEGIESQNQADALKQMGCDYLQGYYFSKPISKNDFFDMIRKK